MTINFSGQITFDVINEFGLHTYIQLTGSNNTIVMSTIYSDSTSSYNSYITLDDNLNFNGFLNIISIISSIYSIPTEINLLTNTTSINSYSAGLDNFTNTDSTSLYTVYYDPVYTNSGIPIGLNNQTIKDMLDFYANVYYNGPTNGGIYGYKHSLIFHGPDPYNRDNGSIILNTTNFTFEGESFFDLTFPYVSPFRSFVYEEGWKSINMFYKFKGVNNTIIPMTGQVTGSIKLEIS